MSTATLAAPDVRPSARTLIDPALGRRIAGEISGIANEMGPAMPGLQQAIRALGCTGADVQVDADPRQMFTEHDRVVGLLCASLELTYLDGHGRPRVSGDHVDGIFEGTLTATGAFRLTRLHIHFDALLD